LCGPSPRPKGVDRIRELLRARHWSLRTAAAHAQWIERRPRFNKRRERGRQRGCGGEDLPRPAVWQAVPLSPYPRIRFAKAATNGRLQRRDRKTGRSPLVAAFLRHPPDRWRYDIGTVWELLGHKDVTTTMMYTDVPNGGGRGVLTPAARRRAAGARSMRLPAGGGSNLLSLAARRVCNSLTALHNPSRKYTAAGARRPAGSSAGRGFD